MRGLEGGLPNSQGLKFIFYRCVTYVNFLSQGVSGAVSCGWVAHLPGVKIYFLVMWPVPWNFMSQGVTAAGVVYRVGCPPRGG